MKKALLVFILTFISIVAYSQTYPTKTVKVEYIMLDNDDIVPSKATVTISTNRITVIRNGETKWWDVEYQGVMNNKDGGHTFKYHVFYLKRHKVYFIISDYKEIYHNGKSYYRIVFDGETQFAS